MYKTVEYETSTGTHPFARWFNRLDANTAIRVTNALHQLRQGNFSNVKSVRNGVYEYRINVGPGYRIYFGRHGEQVIVLLGGGTKSFQQQDINRTVSLWAEYKRRRLEED